MARGTRRLGLTSGAVQSSTFGVRLEHFGIDRKLDGVRCRLGAQIVHARLQTLVPRVKVHRRQFAVVGVLHVDVERLRLINKRAAVRRHVNQVLLTYLPHGPIQILDVLRNLVDALHGAIVRNQLVFQTGRPNAQLDQVRQQVPRHTHKLARQRATHVQVGCVRLDRLVVAQNLRGRRRRHRRQQQTVAHTVLFDLGRRASHFQRVEEGWTFYMSELQHATTDGRVLVARVRSQFFGEILGSRKRRKSTWFQKCRGSARAPWRCRTAFAAEGTHPRILVRQCRNGSVTQIGRFRLLDRIVVDVNDLVQVAHDHLHHIIQFLVIKLSLLHELGQGNRRQDCRRQPCRPSILHDLAAQIRAANGAQILLIRFAVARILVQHIRRSGFGLRIQYSVPNVARFDHFPRAPLLFVLGRTGRSNLSPHVSHNPGDSCGQNSDQDHHPRRDA